MASLITTLFAFGLAFAEPGYAPVGGHDGVAVFVRQNTDAIELAAVGDIAATPAEVQTALLSYGEHPRLIAQLAESKVLSKEPGELVVYQHLKLPVISDRDYTLRVSWEDGAARGIRFRVAGDEGPPAKKGLVRMQVLEGRWDLEPIDGGRATRATYHVQIDFAGSVPRGMVRDGAAKDLPNVYQGYRRFVAERRARGAATAAR